MIVKLKDIKAAVNKKLIETFPKMQPPYGKETVQGHIRPCFFSEIYVKTTSNNKMYNDNEGVITLTYLQVVPNEEDALGKYDAIREAFAKKLKVGERFLNVESIEYSWIGKDANIMQIEIEISYVDSEEEKQKHEIMQNITIKEVF